MCKLPYPSNCDPIQSVCKSSLCITKYVRAVPRLASKWSVTSFPARVRHDSLCTHNCACPSSVKPTCSLIGCPTIVVFSRIASATAHSPFDISCKTDTPVVFLRLDCCKSADSLLRFGVMTSSKLLALCACAIVVLLFEAVLLTIVSI